MTEEGFADYLDILIARMVASGFSRDRTDALIELEITMKRSDATIYKWLNGASLPARSVNLEPAARLGHDRGLDRTWGEGFLRTGQHPDIEKTLKAIWGDANRRIIPCNLPPALQSGFVGRQRQIEKLLERLSPDKGSGIITVDGPGGVGKTAMVLQVAHMCWKASQGFAATPTIPVFDAIIFVSAKQQRLDEAGITRIHYASKTLQSIFSEIATVFHLPKIRLANPRTQREMALEALNDQQARPRGTLIIIDNFETITRRERERVLGLLDHLWAYVKVIITYLFKKGGSVPQFP